MQKTRNRVCIFPVIGLHISCYEFSIFPVLDLYFSCSQMLHFSCLSSFLTTFPQTMANHYLFIPKYDMDIQRGKLPQTF